METEPQSEIYPEQNLTQKILEAAFAVHNSLGCGFLEKVYANALACELRSMSVACEQEVFFKIKYRNFVVGDYCADLIVEKRVIVELKACSALDSIHESQLLNYLKASGIKVGLLLNFGKPKVQYKSWFDNRGRVLSVFICVHLWIQPLFAR